MYGESQVVKAPSESEEKQLKTADDIIRLLVDNFSPIARNEIFLRVGHYLKEENYNEIVKTNEIIEEKGKYAETLKELNW